MGKRLDPKEAEDSSDEEEDMAPTAQTQSGSYEDAGRRTADDDGPTAEDADAAEALTIFFGRQ